MTAGTIVSVGGILVGMLITVGIGAAVGLGVQPERPMLDAIEIIDNANSGFRLIFNEILLEGRCAQFSIWIKLESNIILKIRQGNADRFAVAFNSGRTEQRCAVFGIIEIHFPTGGRTGYGQSDGLFGYDGL